MFLIYRGNDATFGDGTMLKAGNAYNIVSIEERSTGAVQMIVEPPSTSGNHDPEFGYSLYYRNRDKAEEAWPALSLWTDE